MKKRENGFPWLALLLFIVLAAGIMLSLLVALIFTLTGILQLSDVRAFFLGSGFAFLALLLLPPSFYSLRRLIGYPEREGQVSASRWLLILLLALWIGSLLTGQWLIGQNGPAQVIFPPIGILAAALPVGALALIAVNGIPLGSRWL